MFTEYQIRAAMIETIEAAKSELGITGFEVMARNQPEMLRADNVILLDRTGCQRIGFQGRWYDVNEDDETRLNERMEWLEETTFQISVCRQRHIEDTKGTRTGDDVAEMLMAWFNSRRGAYYMRHRGDEDESKVPMAPVFISQKRTQTYTDENDVYQQEEMFDIRVEVLQLLTLKEFKLAGYKFEIHHV